MCVCTYIYIYIHKIIVNIIPILPKKTLRFRDIKELAPGCSADKGQTWGPESGLWDPQSRECCV